MDLKPCPFCGGSASTGFHTSDNGDGFGEVCCDYCTASTQGDFLHWMDGEKEEMMSLDQAITAWNRRAPDLPTDRT